MSGLDVGAIFGPANANLGGKAFAADFRYDTTLGTGHFSATENFVDGGPRSRLGGVSPFLEASLTIGGVAKTIAPDASGEAFASNGEPGLFNGASHDALASNGDEISLQFMNAANDPFGDIPATIDVPLTFTPGSHDFGLGFADLAGAGGLTELQLSPTALIYSLSVSAGAPEPSTWAMMLLGFTGVGVLAACRRRWSPNAA